jgi:DNA-binding transcriptional MerR regulator
MGTELWTLAELAERVAGALSSGYDGQQSRRVTEVPDIRAIRYYTTLGLLDRPAAMRGRTALYGQRHLLQLVAIKRLQAGGDTLAQIQQKLTGAADRTLRSWAALPAEPFWRRVPTPAAAEPTEKSAVDEPVGPVRADPPESVTYQALQLSHGLVVLVPHRFPLTDREIANLRAAAGPLVAAASRLPKGSE